MAKVPSVTVSPKFQVVIPKDVRERLGIRPGQKLLLWDDGRTIQMAPAVGAAHLQGMFRDRPLPPFTREPDRDL